MRTPLGDDSIRKCLTRSELLSPVLMKDKCQEKPDLHAVSGVNVQYMIMIHKSDEETLALFIFHMVWPMTDPLFL